jgi:hypothetical protein
LKFNITELIGSILVIVAITIIQKFRSEPWR